MMYHIRSCAVVPAFRPGLPRCSRAWVMRS